VIGSQRPSIVKFVQADGPSENLLSIGDRILEVNGVSVADATRQHIISLFLSFGTEVILTVGQPSVSSIVFPETILKFSKFLIFSSSQKANKSSILTFAKRAKLHENPRRVRFVESVRISGSPLYEVEHPLDEYRDSIKQTKANSDSDSLFSSRKFSFRSSTKMNCVRTKTDDSSDDDLKKKPSNSVGTPFVNVLKVFLENGQTKTFKYDGQTTVQNIIDQICEKQNILRPECYCIIAEPVRNLGASQRNILLDNREKIVNVSCLACHLP